MRKSIAIVLLLGLAGCHAHRAGYLYESRTGTVSGGSSSGASVSLSGESRLVAGIVIAVMVAEGVRYYIRRPDGSLAPWEPPPGPDPSRKVSEQDCRRAIVSDGGNLRCK